MPPIVPARIHFEKYDFIEWQNLKVKKNIQQLSYVLTTFIVRTLE
jgi:hypothetical protein